MFKKNKVDITGWSYVTRPDDNGYTLLTIEDPDGGYWFRSGLGGVTPYFEDRVPPRYTAGDLDRFGIGTHDLNRVDRYAKKCIVKCKKEYDRLDSVPGPVKKEF